jgi:hypothetical protein
MQSATHCARPLTCNSTLSTATPLLPPPPLLLLLLASGPRSLQGSSRLYSHCTLTSPLMLLARATTSGLHRGAARRLLLLLAAALLLLLLVGQV